MSTAGPRPGRETRVDFPGEQGGVLPEPSRWSGLSRANLAIGQEVSVTPLQIAMAYGAIANGGVLRRPRLVRAVLEEGVFRPLAQSPSRRVVSREPAAAVRRVLQDVVENGTGSSAAIPGVTVAGRQAPPRGCAGWISQRLRRNGPGGLPQLVAVVVFDQPDMEYRWGSALAAPGLSEDSGGSYGHIPGDRPWSATFL